MRTKQKRETSAEKTNQKMWKLKAEKQMNLGLIEPCKCRNLWKSKTQNTRDINRQLGQGHNYDM